MGNPQSAALQPHEFATTPGHLVRLLYQRHNAIWSRTVGESITPIQFAILNVIYVDGPSVQKEVAQRVGADTSTMTQAVGSLERKNLINRTINPADKRERRIALTRSGRREYAQLLPKADAVQEILFSVLAPEDHSLALAVLQDLSNVAAPAVDERP
ncbi:MarR family winged helix-turn-helix transcriptional regulator [Nocardia nepalensis]|uniref:MarR family winged helix-turn-helix transcriptional regulator n=1 Tax=Nocardia nepalensis TaxID=3375448 RepID=UPI003B679924